MIKHKMLMCKKHGMTLHRHRKNRGDSYFCKACYVEYANARRDKLWQAIFSDNFNSCWLCDEDHPGVLQWHHINPEHKKMQVNKGTVTRRDFKTELNKCVLLCANCHGKVHYIAKHHTAKR